MQQQVNQNEMMLILSRQIFKYALPICATNLLGIAGAFFTTMMLAKVGKTELAALALANTCYLTTTAFFGACFSSVGILISKNSAISNKKVVAGIAWNSIWLAIILGIVATILLWYADRLLLFFNQPPELVAHTAAYFHVAALSMTPLMLGSAINQIYNGIGKPMIGTIITLIRLPLVILFSYELILGHYHLGLAGGSAGLLIAQLITLIIIAFHIRFSNIWSWFNVSDISLWNWQQIKQIFNIGIHIGLQFLGELGAMAAATFLMGQLGGVALASTQIVSQYSILIVMLNLGISQALALRVSEACGRREYHLISKYTYSSFLIIIIINAILALFYLFMPLLLIGLFINVRDLQNYQLIQLTRDLMLLSILTLMFDGIKNILTGSLRGLQNSKMPMLIGLFSLWMISLPSSYIIGIFYHGGPIGLRIGFSLGFIFAAIILWFYFRRYKIRFSDGKERSIARQN